MFDGRRPGGVVGVEQRVEEVVGIAVVVEPAVQRQIVLAGPQRALVIGGLAQDDVDRDADLGQALLDDAGDARRRRHVLAGDRRREQLERRLALPLPARLGQQLARARRIVGIGDDVGARAPDVGRQRADRRDAEPLVDQLDQRVAVRMACAIARRMRGSLSGRRCVFIARYETSAAGAIASARSGCRRTSGRSSGASCWMTSAAPDSSACSRWRESGIASSTR